jgi:NDP-sugar pyrophosphorylase family protein
MLIKSDKPDLYRIKALKDFADVKKGDIGGYVGRERNLSHEGNCWIYDDAKVYGYAQAHDNARVYGNAEVSDGAYVLDNATISGNAEVYGNAKVFGNAIITGNVNIRKREKVGSCFILDFLDKLIAYQSPIPVRKEKAKAKEKAEVIQDDSDKIWESI